jgi:hypothetical protein
MGLQARLKGADAFILCVDVRLVDDCVCHIGGA